MAGFEVINDKELRRAKSEEGQSQRDRMEACYDAKQLVFDVTHSQDGTSVSGDLAVSYYPQTRKWGAHIEVGCEVSEKKEANAGPAESMEEAIAKIERWMLRLSKGLKERKKKTNQPKITAYI